MAGKKIAFSGKPKTGDEWIAKGNEGPPSPEPEKEKMKRLTLDIPEALHRKIKAASATRGRKIVEEIREILEKEYPD